MKFSQTDLMMVGPPNDSDQDGIKEAMLPSGNSSSTSFPILIACLTALGVLLIAANVLFVSLYVARRSILKRNHGHHHHGHHGHQGPNSPMRRMSNAIERKPNNLFPADQQCRLLSRDNGDMFEMFEEDKHDSEYLGVRVSLE